MLGFTPPHCREFPYREKRADSEPQRLGEKASRFLAERGFIKTCPPMKSKTCAPFSRLRLRRRKAKLRRYAPCSHLPRLSRRARDPRDLPSSCRPCDGKPGPAAAGYGAQEGAPPATARRRGPRILGGASSLVAWMGDSLTHRQHRHRCPWIKAEIRSAHPNDGARWLGRTSCRIHAELTKLGFVISEMTVSAIHAAASRRARPSETLDYLSAQPQR